MKFAHLIFLSSYSHSKYKSWLLSNNSDALEVYSSSIRKSISFAWKELIFVVSLGQADITTTQSIKHRNVIKSPGLQGHASHSSVTSAILWPVKGIFINKFNGAGVGNLDSIGGDNAANAEWKLSLQLAWYWSAGTPNKWYRSKWHAEIKVSWIPGEVSATTWRIGTHLFVTRTSLTRLCKVVRIWLTLDATSRGRKLSLTVIGDGSRREWLPLTYDVLHHWWRRPRHQRPGLKRNNKVSSSIDWHEEAIIDRVLGWSTCFPEELMMVMDWFFFSGTAIPVRALRVCFCPIVNWDPWVWEAIGWFGNVLIWETTITILDSFWLFVYNFVIINNVTKKYAWVELWFGDLVLSFGGAQFVPQRWGLCSSLACPPSSPKAQA